MTDTTETELAQALEQKVADYQRHFGRLRTIEKLEHMVASRKAAQLLVDNSKARQGDPMPRAAE